MLVSQLSPTPTTRHQRADTKEGAGAGAGAATSPMRAHLTPSNCQVFEPTVSWSFVAGLVGKSIIFFCLSESELGALVTPPLPDGLDVCAERQQGLLFAGLECVRAEGNTNANAGKERLVFD